VTKSEQAKYYRGTAAELQAIAASVMDPQTKSELLEIAAKFGRLAAYVERQRHDCTD
jgi:hypothetical protein